MEFTPTKIPDVILIKPRVFGDSRGYSMESFRMDLFSENIGNINFIQNNESKSSYGVLRGLHYQLPPYVQAKLVRVIIGRVLDVAVDIRKGSSTYGWSVTTELSGENKHQLFIPKGFAHGFVVLSSEAIFSYKVDTPYAPNYERGIRYDDPILAINWQIPLSSIKLSEKDKNLPYLRKTEISGIKE